MGIRTLRKQKPGPSSIQGFLLFIVLLEIITFGESVPENRTEAVGSKVDGIIDKLNSLKKSVKSEKDSLASSSQHGESSSRGGGHGGGYGHGGGGYGHGGGGYGHGAITLDPVSIISLLALGAFLINNILQLLQMNTASGRSLDVYDLNLPLDLSDLEFQEGGSQSYFRGFDNTYDIDEDDPPSFAHFFANLGSLYFLHPTRRNMCIKKVVCNYMSAKETRSTAQRSLRTRVFDFMLMAITKFVAPEITERSGTAACQKYNKYCSDSTLQDAKIKTQDKVYSTVTSLVSNFAIQSLLSG